MSRPPAPNAVITAGFAQAQACSLNPGTGPVNTHLTHHATFVDVNLKAEIYRRAFLAIQRSTASCYLLFGHPVSSLRSPSLSEDKFEKWLSWRLEHLGLEIDTRRMLIILPKSKRDLWRI